VKDGDDLNDVALDPVGNYVGSSRDYQLPRSANPPRATDPGRNRQLLDQRSYAGDDAVRRSRVILRYSFSNVFQPSKNRDAYSIRKLLPRLQEPLVSELGFLLRHNFARIEFGYSGRDFVDLPFPGIDKSRNRLGRKIGMAAIITAVAPPSRC
jgi:hypothetical protein